MTAQFTRMYQRLGPKLTLYSEMLFSSSRTPQLELCPISHPNPNEYYHVDVDCSADSGVLPTTCPTILSYPLHGSSCGILPK